MCQGAQALQQSNGGNSHRTSAAEYQRCSVQVERHCKQDELGLKGIVCLQVYLSARSWQNPEWAHDSAPFGPRRNIWRRGVPVQLCADGSVEFEGAERAEKVDVVMHATGYKYTFPFLSEAGVVTVHDNR